MIRYPITLRYAGDKPSSKDIRSIKPAARWLYPNEDWENTDTIQENGKWYLVPNSTQPKQEYNDLYALVTAGLGENRVNR